MIQESKTKQKVKIKKQDTINKDIIKNISKENLSDYKKEQEKIFKEYNKSLLKEIRIFNISKNIIRNNDKIWCPDLNTKL